jgi:hypothetical protein
VSWVPLLVSPVLGVVSYIAGFAGRGHLPADIWLRRGRRAIAAVWMLAVAPWPIILSRAPPGRPVVLLLPAIFWLLPAVHLALVLWRIRVVAFDEHGVTIRGWRVDRTVPWDLVQNAWVEGLLPRLALRLRAGGATIVATVAPALLPGVLRELRAHVPRAALDPRLREEGNHDPDAP